MWDKLALRFCGGSLVSETIFKIFQGLSDKTNYAQNLRSTQSIAVIFRDRHHSVRLSSLSPPLSFIRQVTGENGGPQKGH